MLLQRQMGVAFIIKDVFADVVGRGKTHFHIAKLQRDALMDVAFLGIVVDLYILVCQGIFNCHQCRKRFVLDNDRFQGGFGCLLIHRGDGGHRIADHAYLFHTEGFFVLADGQDAILHRQVFAGDDGIDAGALQRGRGVNEFDQRVRVGTAEDAAVGHARQKDVISKERLPFDFAHRINLHPRFADNV